MLKGGHHLANKKIKLPMRKLIFLLVCMLAILITKAQVVIQGKVLDNATNLPIANASVYLNSTSVGAITNLKGEFIFTASSSFIPVN
ncbi:MAG: carboxypeptidase-like regulatory domain-containing protein [Ferruginibacter sp.]